MYISRIKLVNFQRYKDIEIKLDPRFNAITGSSDLGKSSILRSIIWVIYNKPSGTEMCRYGTDQTVVTVWTSTGHEVSRIRSNTRNAYILDGQSYDNIGTDVPLEVQNALGISIAEIGRGVYEMLNVSRQMDGPFMLSSSSTDSAKIIGNLAGITTLDIGLSSLRPDLLEANKKINVLDRIEENYKVSIIEFEDLDNEANILKAIGSRIKVAQDLSSRLDNLSKIQTRMIQYNAIVSTVDDSILEQERILSYRDRVNDIIQSHKYLSKLIDMKETTIEYNTKFTQVNTDITKIQDHIVELTNTHKDLLHTIGICPTCKRNI